MTDRYLSGKISIKISIRNLSGANRDRGRRTMKTEVVPTRCRGRVTRGGSLLVLALWCVVWGIPYGLSSGLVCAGTPKGERSADQHLRKRRDLSQLRQSELFALVVGVSSYKDPKIPPLQLAAKDATDVAEFLKSQRGLYKNVRIKLLVNEAATREEIEKFLLYDVQTAGNNDSVILYFSGHGAVDPRRGGEYFFVTYDTKPDYLGATGVLMSCSRFFKGLEARHVLVVADTCHAGSLSEMQTKSLTNSLESFMREFRNSSGWVIVASSKPDEYSLEVPGLPNGVFTHFLLEALKGAADKDRDGIISLREAYRYVYAKTKDRTKGAQHPQFEGKVVGAFPVSARPPGVTVQLVTRPAGAEVFVRDELSFKSCGKTDGKGHIAIEDLPVNEPIIIMVKKQGWKDRILDPMVFSRADLQVNPQSIELEQALAFLLLRTNTSGVHISVSGKEIGETGDNNFLIASDVQVGVPHEILFRKEGYHERKLTLQIPESHEGKVYQAPVVKLKKKGHGVIAKKQVRPVPAADTPGKGSTKDDTASQKPEVNTVAARRLHLKKMFDAVRAGALEELKQLLHETTDVNATDQSGWTALMHACHAGNKDVARLLIDKGANVNCQDSLGWTPLMVAAGSGDEAMTRLLIEKKADPKARNRYGETAATCALVGRHTAVLKVLGVQPPAPPAKYKETVTRNKLTAQLFHVVKRGDRSGLEKILTEKIDLNARDDLAWTPLMHACSLGRTEMVKLLIERGADVNCKDKLGWTPLMISAGNGNARMVKLLLSKGALKDARNAYGETAASRAMVGKHEKVMKLLGVAPEPSPARRTARHRSDSKAQPRIPARTSTSDEGLAGSFPQVPSSSETDDSAVWHYDGRPHGKGPWTSR